MNAASDVCVGREVGYMYVLSEPERFTHLKDGSDVGVGRELGVCGRARRRRPPVLRRLRPAVCVCVRFRVQG